jgi:hypothetical protein
VTSIVKSFEGYVGTAYTPAMSEKPKPDDDDQRKTEKVLKRMLHTKPTPFTPKKKNPKKKAAK